MADNKIHMPSSMGGLVRYFDEYKSKISLKPGSIVVIAIVIIVLLIILNAYGKPFLGI